MVGKISRVLGSGGPLPIIECGRHVYLAVGPLNMLGLDRIRKNLNHWKQENLFYLSDEGNLPLGRVDRSIICVTIWGLVFNVE